MRSTIKSIGIIDHAGKVHSVELEAGVNVITGKSSTGKSALLEIFDYCFGSNTFTIPEGVITANASIYFTVIQLENLHLTLARKANEKNAFLISEAFDPTDKIKEIKCLYFDDKYILGSDDFKKELKRHFNLQVTDVSNEDLPYKSKYTPPAPSIRSFTSFMLQHQNLVANKHALFYRFDEAIKREQVIDHFKIFLGYADQEYFTKTQILNSLRAQERSLKYRIPSENKRKNAAAEEFNSLLRGYASITGFMLDAPCLRDIIKTPKAALSYIQNLKIEFQSDSKKHLLQKQNAERTLSKKKGELRTLQQKCEDIVSSINFAKEYSEKTSDIASPTEATVQHSFCPFCKKPHDRIETSANELTEAITWLNNELSRSQYFLESFAKEKKQTEEGIKVIQKEILIEERNLKQLIEQNQWLKENKTPYELALKTKLQMENTLEALLTSPDKNSEEKLKKLQEKIGKKEKELRQRYDIPKKMKAAEKLLKGYMAELTPHLDFEESYRPVQLEFSFDKFDLWSKNDAGKKFFLRSMGSGANWLSCHVALFLALQKLFCTLGSKCSIPSVLFFDQPSQVYFPTVFDDDQEFIPEKHVKDENFVDHDIKAVTNLYTQLVKFCRQTFEETKIMPQIIITDHADNLDIDGDIPFKKLVKARWRDNGFVDPVVKN